MPGDKYLGAVSYEFDGDRLSAGIVVVPGLTEHWIDPVIEQVYPLHEIGEAHKAMAENKNFGKLILLIN